MALTPCDGRARVRSTSPASRCRPRSGGPTSAASPLYLLDADVDENPPDVPHGHRPPLRRRHRAPHPPGDPPRHRRRAGARRARPSTRRCSTPTRATPASSASSASASSSPTRASLRRGDRGGAGRHHLHHPHAGAGRHRPLPARADGAVLRRLGRRVRRHVRRAHGPRPPPGDEPDERFNMAVMGLRLAGRVQRRGQAARRGQPGDVRRPLAGRARRRGADQVGHQRRARAAPGCRPRWTTLLSRYVLPGLGRGRRRALGAHRRRRATTSSGGCASRAASGWWRSSAAASASARWPGAVGLRRRRGPTRCSTRRCSRSASPAASPPTSGPPCCCRSPSGCERSCSSRPTRCSSCSPARPTRPTSSARS